MFLRRQVRYISLVIVLVIVAPMVLTHPASVVAATCGKWAGSVSDKDPRIEVQLVTAGSGDGCQGSFHLFAHTAVLGGLPGYILDLTQTGAENVDIALSGGFPSPAATRLLIPSLFTDVKLSPKTPGAASRSALGGDALTATALTADVAYLLVQAVLDAIPLPTACVLTTEQTIALAFNASHTLDAAIGRLLQPKPDMNGAIDELLSIKDTFLSTAMDHMADVAVGCPVDVVKKLAAGVGFGWLGGALDAVTTVAAIITDTVRYQGKPAQASFAYAFPTAVPVVQAPKAPTNLRMTGPSGQTANLSWDINSQDEEGFRIYSGGKVVATGVPHFATGVVSNLTLGQNYCFNVVAFNRAGESPPSNEVCTSPGSSVVQAVANEIAYVSAGGDLWIANVDGSGARKILAGPISSPSWSHDGTRIVFVRGIDPGTKSTYSPNEGKQIEIVNADGSGQAVLVAPIPTQDNVSNGTVYSKFFSVRWAPDDTAIYYVWKDGAANGWRSTRRALKSSDEKPADIYGADFDVGRDGTISASEYNNTKGYSEISLIAPGTQARLLVSMAWGPSWSPDSKQIAYAKADGLHIIDQSASNDHLVFSGPVDSTGWSPDGKILLYVSAGILWTIPVSGGTPTKLFAGTSPAWRPQVSGSTNTSSSPSTTASLPSLRSVNWLDVLMHDPDLSAAPPTQQQNAATVCMRQPINLWVRYKGNSSVEGIPDSASILYGDIVSDGGEEAIIYLFAGCGAVNVFSPGSLIYHMTPAGPRIVTDGPGTSIFPAQIANNRLQQRQPTSDPFNGQNPSSVGWRIDEYQLQGNKLVQVGSRIETPSSTNTQTAWTSPDQKITLSYPQGWRATRDATDQFSILELDSPNSGFFYLSEYVPGSSAAGSTLTGIQGYKDRQLKRTDRRYTQGPIQQMQVAGRPAAYMEFQSTSKTNASDVNTGVAWYIDGPDRQFVIEAFTKGPTFRDREDVNAIISTILFSGSAPSSNTSQGTFKVTGTTPTNGATNVSAGEIPISFSTDSSIASAQDYSLEIDPPLPFYWKFTNAYPTNQMTAQVYGGLKTSTRYTLTVKDKAKVSVYSWSFTTSDRPAECSCLLASAQDQEVQEKYYPLFPYIPYTTAQWKIDYTERLTLEVIIYEPDAAPPKSLDQIKREVTTWIRSKGVDPATHKIAYKRNGKIVG